MRRPTAVRPHEDKIGLIQRIADAVWIIVAHGIASLVYADSWNRNHTVAIAFGVVVFLLVAEANGLYRSWRAVPMKRELAKVWTTWAIAIPFLLFLAFVTKTSEDYSRLITVTWFSATPIVLSLWRAGIRLLLQELRARGRNTRSVAIVGATEVGVRLAGEILQQPWTGFRLTGFFDDRDVSRRIAVPEVIGKVRGSLDDVVARARNGEIDTVYVALPMRAEHRIRRLFQDLSDTTASVYVVPDFFAFDLLRAEWTNLGDIPVVSVFETPFFGVDGWLKRLEDLVLGTAILALISIPMLVIAALVKLTSPGPVLFRQRRYGLNGEEIEVLKFRTMTVCEDGPVVKQAQKNDSRITKIGAILRRTSLDELPQFLHVITGKMSIVGPRPHAVAHNEEYRRLIQGYMLRHKVKPGITGWAQVNGWRGETDTIQKMEMRIEHDLEYIRRWSLLWDLKIIFLTVFGRQVRQNAY